MSMTIQVSDILPAPRSAHVDQCTGTAHHEHAQSVLTLLRNRAKAEDIMAHLETVKNTLESDGEMNVDSTIRSIAVQALLHIGSRSFSHFLNAIERYLPLLRNLASGSISTTGISNLEGRMDILNAVSAFWKHSKHMIIIVFDKLMQYQIVDPTDVVAWAFTKGTDDRAAGTQPYIGSLEWEIVQGALNKANGRVVIARRKVATLRKEDDEKAALAKVKSGAAMEVDAETKPGAYCSSHLSSNPSHPSPCQSMHPKSPPRWQMRSRRLPS